MEKTPPKPKSRQPSPGISPLKQHPISPLLLSSNSDVTQTILLNNSGARLSSSPASSPRIVDPAQPRRGSVHPAMSETLKQSQEPGANFFSDGSSESEWEDSEGEVTQTFSEVEGFSQKRENHLGQANMATKEEEKGRGRSRKEADVDDFRASSPLIAEDSGLGIMDAETGSPIFSSPIQDIRAVRARQMSLRRMGKDNVRLVHTRSSNGTPRDSLRSNNSNSSRFADLPTTFPPASTASTAMNRSEGFMKGHHRRDTAESVIADSIVNSHAVTMRALEALGGSPSAASPPPRRSRLNSISVSDSVRPSSSLRERQIKLAPLSIADEDSERPAHLPSHFVRTPYPFTAKKEFPKPLNRPRRHSDLTDRNRDSGSRYSRLDSGYGEDVTQNHGSRKGKHILGLTTNCGDVDPRSRQARNEEAQGVIRSRAGSGRDNGKAIVVLSLLKPGSRKCSEDLGRNLYYITIPATLTASSPDYNEKRGRGKIKKGAEIETDATSSPIDFDDAYFARQLSIAHRHLAGPWIFRILSARQMCAIRLAYVNTWSGASHLRKDERSEAGHLLAVGGGLKDDDDARSPFTEDSLLRLYCHPSSGRARYTWVHWARRVAAFNEPTHVTREPSTVRLERRRTRSLDRDFDFKPSQSTREISIDYCDATTTSEGLMTIQFVHPISKLKVLLALGLMLVLSTMTASLWVFLGPEGLGFRMSENRQRSERVGGGLAMGITASLLEGLLFAVWVWLS